MPAVPYVVGMTFLVIFAIYIGLAYAKVEIDHLFPWLVMQLGAPLYVGLWGGMNVLMMGNGQGFEHCYPFILVMTGVWLCDTVAYFFGKFAAGKGPFGRHLFAPSISPKKTWEGSVAGSIATVAWVAYWAKCSAALGCFNVDIDWAKAIGLGLLVTVAGQVGDLLMSALKRWSGTKDSGNLFVGHGGVLDRCDSFYLAAPALYLLMDFFQKLA
jgi:phosphatidate cytidylyltransferase